MEKNYSYLAIQLQKFCHSYGRRQLEVAFLQLAQHALKASSVQVGNHMEVEPRTAAVLAPVEPQSHGPSRAPDSSRSRRVRAENVQLGFQTLSSILALQLRYALRRWENFARRKQFEERQSKVVHALRNVQAELDGKRRYPGHSPTAISELSQSLQSPELSPGTAESTPHFRGHNVHEVRTELQAIGGYGSHVYGSPKKSHGFPNDEDFVKSLSEDQARIDEVIKLAAILWDNASLANMQPAALPLVLLRASLLARMAERCQRHVMKEALHLLWKRCTLQRSMEELISQGFVKRDMSEASRSAVTQPPLEQRHQPSVPLGHRDEDFPEDQSDVQHEHVASAPEVQVEALEGLHEAPSEAAEAPAETETEAPDLETRRSSMASETAPRATWDALADAVGGRTTGTTGTTGTGPVTQPQAPAPRPGPVPGSARPGPTVIAMGLESEEPSEAESDIDDDALVAILG